MSDLISREELISRIILANNRSSLGETVSGFNLSGIGVVGVIKDMEIAYDVDKVVKRLEEYKSLTKNNWEESGKRLDKESIEYYRGRYNSAVDMINIVKGGGRNE